MSFECSWLDWWLPPLLQSFPQHNSTHHKGDLKMTFGKSIILALAERLISKWIVHLVWNLKTPQLLQVTPSITWAMSCMHVYVVHNEGISVNRLSSNLFSKKLSFNVFSFQVSFYVLTISGPLFNRIS